MAGEKGGAERSLDAPYIPMDGRQRLLFSPPEAYSVIVPALFANALRKLTP